MSCSVENCERKVIAKGYCSRHYQAERKYGDPTVVKQVQHHGLTLMERFDKYVDRKDGCWEWKSFKDPNGYGRLNIDGKPILAHRLAYELYHGKVPDGMSVCHTCDNPGCANPRHLFAGTHADNMHDMIHKGRDRKAPVTGTDHHNAKLNAEAARDIRASTETRAVLAKRYGVAQATIHSVQSGRTWKE